jgi:predicted nucleic acid-binding protein
MAYLLDANVFIEAKRRHYGLDFCPAFWEWLVEQNDAGRVYSIEKVGDELRAGGDELAEWADARGEAFFLPPDEPLLASLSAVAEWVQGQQFRPAAIGAFLDDPDYYLVSHAHAHGHVVVTHEVPSDGVRQVKIPNVCIGMKVKCMTPFEMLRLERARFVLGRGKPPA